MDAGKIRFAIEATTTGQVVARAIDVALPVTAARSLGELRVKLAELVRTRFPSRGLALLVGAARPPARVEPDPVGTEAMGDRPGSEPQLTAP